MSDIPVQKTNEPKLTLKEIIGQRYSKTGKKITDFFGVVYQAKDEKKAIPVSIKLYQQSEEDIDGIQSNCLREIAILKKLNHNNIIKMIDYYYGIEGCYIVFESCDRNLEEYIKTFAGELSLNTVQLISKQLLEAVEYLHSHRILHRDIRPSNIILSLSRTIKLTNFSLSRQVTIPIRKYTQEVANIWYRAPEIILGDQGYGTGVDIWSVGCVVAELINSKPLFSGDCKIGQLFQIFQIFGTPTEESWPGVTQMINWSNRFPKFKGKTLHSVCSRIGDQGIDLLNKMLCCYSNKRIDAKEALNHPFISFYN
ncbi:protein kinase domain containing protein [Entamoeba histolytica HM-3:IMSS]|uniref:cyclin-dependent kinase n=1 Tax=Entamoeba histolytica HM-3:IMSS TaxID=885315 RepID=M7W8Z4_ENTHI|nr:protein kinase domain containing protein [Entamoeba histolytica HM-3:IMSS]